MDVDEDIAVAKLEFFMLTEETPPFLYLNLVVKFLFNLV